mmetsp:Transcript_14544/g.21241  ORF Transcript_14544/g.21241 Transcript_14544/m.21241 type:complete len:84 (+) Transcript_14544:388-639(+)
MCEQKDTAKVDPTSKEVFLVGSEGNNYRLSDAERKIVRVSSSFEEIGKGLVEVQVKKTHTESEEGNPGAEEPVSSTTRSEPEE